MSAEPDALARRETAHEALGRVARELVERVDLDAIAARLAELPTAPLVSELDAIVQALASAEARRARPRGGVIGRLLAREPAARLQPDPVDNRVRVHLAFAAEHAAALERHLGGLQVLAEHLARHSESLAAIAERGRTVPGAVPATDGALHAPDPALRRLAQLDAILASWQRARAHLVMALDFGRSVLDRHAQVRDVLVPLWRQELDGPPLSMRVRDADAVRLAALREALRKQIDGLRGGPRPTPADD